MHGDGGALQMCHVLLRKGAVDDRRHKRRDCAFTKERVAVREQRGYEHRAGQSSAVRRLRTAISGLANMLEKPPKHLDWHPAHAGLN